MNEPTKQVKRLLQILDERKMSVVLKDGQPFIRGDPDERTQVLMSALKECRDDLVAYLEGVQAEQRAGSETTS